MEHGTSWSTQWDMRLPEWDMGHKWSTQWDMRTPEWDINGQHSGT